MKLNLYQLRNRRYNFLLENAPGAADSHTRLFATNLRAKRDLYLV